MTTEHDLMGDGTDVINATNDAADEGAEQPNPDSQHSQEQDDARANREAARYRRQLREVEAERDELRVALTSARATILAGITGSGIANGAHAEVFTDPDACFNPDGTINQDAVDAAIQEARESRPYLFSRTALLIPAEGKQPPKGGETRDDFAAAFAPPARY